MSDNTSPTSEESNSTMDAEPLSSEEMAALKAARAERLAARIAHAELTQTGGEDWYFLHDPIEDDPQIAPLIKAAEKKAQKETRAYGIVLGRCHMLWTTQREILREEYGVEWFSPAEMNPYITFD